MQSVPVYPVFNKPGKVTTIAVATLIDGILNVLWSVAIVVFLLSFSFTTFGLSCLLLPMAVYPLVVGVLDILYAAKLIPEPAKSVKPGHGLAIMQVCNIVTGNLLSFTVGVVALILYNDGEVNNYFASLASS